MAANFQQTDDNAAQTNAQCSPNAQNSTQTSCEASNGGTAGSTERTADMDAGGTDLDTVWMEVIDIDDYDGAAGDWTTRLSITTTNHHITLDTIHICHVGSDYSTKGTIGSLTAIGAIINTVEVQEHVVNQASAITIAAGDKIVIIYGFSNAQTMPQTMGWTPDQVTVGPGAIAQNINVGTASETDTAQAIQPSRDVPVGTALETDSARAISLARNLSVGTALETDTAQSIGIISGTLLVFTQTDTAPSCAMDPFCSGGTDDGDEGRNARSLCEVGGTPGTDAKQFQCAALDTNQVGIQFELAPDAGVDWNAGTWTVRFRTTGGSDMFWEEVHICRVDSACTNQETIGSTTGLGIDVAPAEVKTATVDGAAQTPAAGDKIQIICIFSNINNNTEISAIVADQDIDTPLVAAAETNVNVGTASETDTALSVQASKDVPVGLASETDTAQSITPSKSVPVGTASETDSALAIQLINDTLLSFTQTDTAPSCAMDPFCSGGVNEGDQGENVRSLCQVGGTPGAVNQDFIVPAGGTNQIGVQFELAPDDGTTWNAGDWTVRLNVQQEEPEVVTWDAVHICRVNSGCTNQETIGSKSNLGISMGTTGVKTAILNGAAQTPASGDKIQIICIFSSTSGQDEFVVILPDQDIDTPLVGPGAINVDVGTASETDTAQAVQASKDVPVGTALETDTALIILVGGDINVDVGTALETDSALAIQVSKSLAVGTASETDSALGIQATKDVAVGTASETDSAQSIQASRDVAVGIATETDTALGISAGEPANVPVGTALETDTALSIQATRDVAVGTAVETDTALSIGHSKSVQVGVASETDSALAIQASRDVAVGVAVETDSALAIQTTTSVAVGLATETDTALPLSLPKSVSVGIAIETDTALAIGFGGTFTGTASVTVPMPTISGLGNTDIVFIPRGDPRLRRAATVCKREAAPVR